MKILFLVNHLAEYGGIQRMLNHKFLAFHKFGNCEIVLVTRFQNNRNFLFESHAMTKKYDVNINGGTSFLNNLKMKFTFYKRVDEIIRKEQPDVVITTLTSFYALILPFIGLGTPKIIEFHSSAATIKAGKWYFKKYFYKLYNAVVVLNEDEKNSYDLPNTVVIPNFIHENEQASYPEFTNRNKIIIAAGRMEPVKQFDHLIFVWKQLSTKYPEWKIEIYGDGTEKNTLERLLIENDLTDTVKLMGNTNNLSKVMRESSIYCMTSKTDCFPMVLLEAKQAGLPIISYDCPYGPRHIVKNGEDGILIEANDIANFTTALENVILDETKRERMAKKSYDNFKEFSSDNVVPLWFNLFDKLRSQYGK